MYRCQSVVGGELFEGEELIYISPNSLSTMPWSVKFHHYKSGCLGPP